MHESKLDMLCKVRPNLCLICSLEKCFTKSSSRTVPNRVFVHLAPKRSLCEVGVLSPGVQSGLTLTFSSTRSHGLHVGVIYWVLNLLYFFCDAVRLIREGGLRATSHFYHNGDGGYAYHYQLGTQRSIYFKCVQYDKFQFIQDNLFLALYHYCTLSVCFIKKL